MNLELSMVKFHPLGINPEKNAILFSVSTSIQLVFIYLLGVESKLRPQLLDNYGIYIPLIIVLVYCFPWLFSIFEIITKSSIHFKSPPNGEKLIDRERENEREIERETERETENHDITTSKDIRVKFRLSKIKVKNYSIISIVLNFLF